MGVAALPNASAQNCTLTVTLVTGQTLSFNVPPGTSPSSLSLPAPVATFYESCPPPPSTTPTQTTPPPTTSTGGSGSPHTGTGTGTGTGTTPKPPPKVTVPSAPN